MVWPKRSEEKGRTSSLENLLKILKPYLLEIPFFAYFSLKTENSSVKCIIFFVLTVYSSVFDWYTVRFSDFCRKIAKKHWLPEKCALFGGLHAEKVWFSRPNDLPKMSLRFWYFCMAGLSSERAFRNILRFWNPITETPPSTLMKSCKKWAGNLQNREVLARFWFCFHFFQFYLIDLI